MDTDSVTNFIVTDIAEDVKSRYDTSNHEQERPLPMKK